MAATATQDRASSPSQRWFDNGSVSRLERLPLFGDGMVEVARSLTGGLPSATGVTLRPGGHLAYLEQQDQVSRAIALFAAEHGAVECDRLRDVLAQEREGVDAAQLNFWIGLAFHRFSAATQ